jgi:hypothetical protein
VNRANHTQRTWKRWQKALLCSVIWITLTVGAGMVHVNVVLAGKLTEAQDEAISERYGMACGAGLVAILAFIFLRKVRRD